MRKRLLSVLILAVLLLVNVSAGHAQGPVTTSNPPDSHHSCAPIEVCKGTDRHEFMPGGAQSPAEMDVLTPQETGGPDDYGYTWDDSVGMNWINATNGTDTGMSGSSWGQATGPISLPFSFRFYGEVYDQVYIAASGYLSFVDQDYWPTQQGSLPSTTPPNNLVAAFWTIIQLEEKGSDGRVYYRSGGTAPNRYFVVEWHDVKGGTSSDASGGDETYRFEIILYENGDILFQYHTMTYNDWRYYASIGIEDSRGLDGLGYMDWGNYWDRLPASGYAIRFYHPEPSARVGIWPLYSGEFTCADEDTTFEIPIRNSGELGADVYDITISSTWPVSLYAADGTTPLSDTDDDGTVDTGSVTQGDGTTVVAKVTTPDAVNLGDANTAVATVRSSLNTAKSKIVSLQTSVPAPFTQVFRDDADDAMSLYLVRPNVQRLKQVTPGSYPGDNMAVAEMPNSFAYVWTKDRTLNDNVSVREIEYTLLDSDGDTVRAVSKLTDHSGATVNTYDYSVMAVAPNGRIGVLWYRYRYNSNNGERNANVFFAVLDSSGSLAYGPVNVTNNTIWGGWGDYGVPLFYNPRIAATDDNRFFLAWEREQEESNGRLEDVYYTVRDANGNAVKEVTKFTNGVVGGDSYNTPALTSLSQNRVLLAYQGPSGISYAVLSSAGNTVKAETTTWNYGWRPDVVQLSDGTILLAWTYSGEIEFVVLDDTTYNVIAGPRALTNPAAPIGNDYVSVTADGMGHGVLTWTDAGYSYRRNLYYALVDGSGDVLSDPMIFRVSQATEPSINTSYMGYGNTSYSDRTPPTSQAQSPEFALEPFQVTWSGSDEELGVVSYDVQVRDGLDGTWSNWLEDTTDVSAPYNAIEAGHTYYFRSVAQDLAGNVETDLPEDGDTHTTVAEYKVEGQVSNNRGQPVFNTTISAQPSALNAATTDSAGYYTLYVGSSGPYTLTTSRSGFGALPAMYNVAVDGHLTGVDFVLLPENEVVINGGWETADLTGWNSGLGVTPTVEMTATHTGLYGLALEASGGTVSFWPYVTQTVSIPSTWAQPTLSFLYKAVEGEADDALQAVVSDGGEVITHTVKLTSTSWTHTWNDLSAFSGQTVTLYFGFEEQASDQRVYLDEISVGETEAGVVSVYLPLVMRNR